MEPDHMLLNYTVPTVQSFTIQCKRLKHKATILTISKVPAMIDIGRKHLTTYRNLGIT